MPGTFSYLTDDEIESDIEASAKPPVYEHQQGYPFGTLGDRQFECLLHDIFSAEARPNTSRFGEFDRALLMQGVGERGRDCALVMNGKHVGVVQCKRYESLLSKPDVAREIIKFCLHAILDPALMPEPQGFRYIFAVSKDFNERAKLLLNSFNTKIENEPELLSWIQEVVRENKRLEHLKPAEVQQKLLDILKSIDVKPLGFNELNTMLVGKDIVVQKYFTLKKVISEERLQPIEKMLEAIVNKITDEDVRRLLDELQNQPQDRRFDIGMMSLWGYPQEFVDYLFKSGQFKSLGMILAASKAQLDAEFLELLRQKIEDEILINITSRREFSPLTIQAASPYVFAKLAERWCRNQQGRTLTAILPTPHVRTDALSIRSHLLETGEAVLRNDFSMVVGDKDILALKKGILRFVYGNFRTRAEMEKTFDEEWPKMVPILDEIERKLEALIPGSTTIVLRSMGWFDDESHLKSVLNTAQALDKRAE